MSQKLDFVKKAAAPGANVSALCREYGISRQTGHKWLQRYRSGGHLALAEQSRRPMSSPLATAEEVVVGIIELRDRHPSWGPQVIARVLERRLGESAPSPSTVARVLRRLGKIKKRRPPVRVWSVDGRPRVEVGAPNDLWTIDFKGWWRAANGDKCEPLTVRDAYSRKVLAVELGVNTRATHVRRVLERLFKLHGLPVAMQSDNGTPFVAVRARGGLTRLAVWLVSLGIRLVRSRPAKPQDNGGHERMHRDLSELQLSPARSRRSQQRACDEWLIDFNHVRPHQALGGKTPEEVFRNSPRRGLVPKLPSYPPGWITRRVNSIGEVHLHGDQVFLSKALSGQLVGLEQETELHWHARFFDIDLGTIEVLPVTEALLPRAQLVQADASVAPRVPKRQRAVA
jgi:transposase InsO family protein